MDLSKQAILSLITSENPIILDVGMYDGEDSREMAELMPNAMIYGFECDPRSISLYKSFKNPDNIILNEVAIGSKNGLVDLFMSDSETRRHYTNQDSWSASSSLRRPKEHLNIWKDVQYEKSIKVECMSLDNWYEKTILGKVIDFIWADVNGAEYDLVLGAQKTLNESTKYLYIEFSEKELFAGQAKKEKTMELLPNFQLVGIYNHSENYYNALLKNTTL